MRIPEMDVDDVLFEMLERIQRLESPRSPKLVDASGLTYAPSCACGSTERFFAEVTIDEAPDRPLHRYVCAECGELWIFRHGDIVVHEVQVPPACGLEHERGEIEQLHGALKLLTRWESRLYLQLYLWEDVRDRTDLAAQANRRWRTVRCGRWTEWKVRQTIAGAQRKIFNELGLPARARRHPQMKLEDHRKNRQPGPM